MIGSLFNLYILYGVIPLFLGWLLDRLLGDPAWLPHPVVGFGKMIGWLERRLNSGDHRRRNGAFVAAGLVLLVFVSVYIVVVSLTSLPWLRIAVETIGVYFCLAGRTLSREVKMVFTACTQSPDAGRRQVARIVGRDTRALSLREVRTAALETLAENMSDGVVAPVFWYALAGLPGMFAYKMINTLDSMIGYKNERYIDFGQFAARMDDVANFIPARLTAFFMVLASGRFRLWQFVKRYGPEHASPNSGWPEAALAGILDCRFGGTHEYFGKPVYKPYIGENEREIDNRDLDVAIHACFATELIAIVMMCLLIPAGVILTS